MRCFCSLPNTHPPWTPSHLLPRSQHLFTPNTHLTYTPHPVDTHATPVTNTLYYLLVILVTNTTSGSYTILLIHKHTSPVYSTSHLTYAPHLMYSPHLYLTGTNLPSSPSIPHIHLLLPHNNAFLPNHTCSIHHTLRFPLTRLLRHKSTYSILLYKGMYTSIYTSVHIKILHS